MWYQCFWCVLVVTLRMLTIPVLGGDDDSDDLEAKLVSDYVQFYNIKHVYIINEGQC